jgi:hypothetical protein
MRSSCILAEIPGFGRVYDRGGYGGIHVTVGPVSLTLTPEAYMQLVTKIHKSAANFESWLATNQGGHRRAEGSYVDTDSERNPG